MSSNRVNWTCPSCGKVYAVPTTIGLTVCPAFNPTAISPPRAVSVTLPRSALIGLLIVVAVLGFTAGLASSPMLASRSGMAPAGKIERPQVAAMTTDPDKVAVEQWLRNNLDDGSWEEVQWWPVFDQTQAIGDELLVYEKGLKDNPNNDSAWRYDIALLKSAPRKIARMRYRTKNRSGALEMRNTVFGISGDKVVADNEVVMTRAAQRAIDSELR